MDGSTQPLVHRDLKPGNVLIGEDGHGQRTDFGGAKENASKSAEQTTCGTPLYMSPEQVHPATMQEGGYSYTVDWWALGTLIFEALAGRPLQVLSLEYDIRGLCASEDRAWVVDAGARKIHELEMVSDDADF